MKEIAKKFGGFFFYCYLCISLTFILTAMKETLIRIYRWCRRYISLTLIIVVSYIVYMVFFDEHSVLEKMKLQEEIKELKSQIKHYSDSLNYYTKQFQLLNTDVETMEKIVRENYHMQHPDEDVFVFENPNQQ